MYRDNEQIVVSQGIKVRVAEHNDGSWAQVFL